MMPTAIVDYLSFLDQLITGFRYRHEMMIAHRRDDDLSPYPLPAGSSILDLANGRLRPQYTVLSARRLRVYGVDLANQPQKGWAELGYRLARRWFNRQAGIVRQGEIPPGLCCGNVAALPFASASFDLITSVAAFEHFLDVPAVVKESHRILKPSGLMWVWIHPFTALSGGHNVKLMEIPLRKLPGHVDPWDHLRQRRIPFHVPLNAWRIQQYLDQFSQWFDILKHECVMREGQDYLTPAIQAELGMYSPDELTCAAYVIVARKP